MYVDKLQMVKKNIGVQGDYFLTLTEFPGEHTRLKRDVTTAKNSASQPSNLKWSGKMLHELGKNTHCAMPEVSHAHKLLHS